MQFTNREDMISELQNSFQSLINKYQFEDIGVFEEQGQHDSYHLGYTIRKNGKTFMVHTPYIKNQDGQLAYGKEQWTIETDEPNTKDVSGFHNLDEALRTI